jgi:leader peptidase (prepilin peptidase) / N-methyltransferase
MAKWIAPLLTAILFGILAWRFGAHLDLLPYSCLAAGGVALAVIDVVEQRLPSPLIYSSFAVVAVMFAVSAILHGSGSNFLRALAGMAILATFYLILALVSRGGLGAGDVKLGGVLGLAMGWQNWSTILIGTILGWSLAALVRLAFRLSGRWQRDSAMSLGPFLLVGAFAAVLAAVG